MCGASLPGQPRGGFRRAASGVNLFGAEPAHEATGLKPCKSVPDLLAAVHDLLDGGVAAGLPSLRTSDHHRASASGSSACGQSSSGDDTARGSPTSSYEQLLRSRSPSAVLFAGGEEEPGAGKPAAFRSGSPAALCSSSPPALLAPADGAEAWADQPFLESAAAFSVVPVDVAAGSTPPSLEPTLPRAAPLHVAIERELAGPGLGLTGAAGAASAGSAAVATARDPVCAAAAAAAAASPPAASPPGPAHAASGDVASPFARMALEAQPPMISHSPPHAPRCLGGGSPPLPRSASSSGTSTPRPGTASHASRSGSLAAELSASAAGVGGGAPLSRRGSVDCTVGHSSHLSEGHAAEELFYRLNHARQTVDFVKRQAHAFSQLNKAALGVWQALDLLNTLREYEAALLGEPDAVPDMPLLEHALQCAEACRAAFPDEPHMHLAGLLAPLGKLLAHAKFGAEPQFAICGETFPVGCRFHPAVAYSQYFCANPDRRKRLYNSPTGVYRQGCGLGSVLMSWGAGEYLHLVLRLNRASLPPEALFCLRHQALRCVFRQGAPYSELLSEFDRVQLPRLAKFQQLCAYARQPRAEPLLVPAPGGGDGPPQLVPAPELKRYYDSLIARYLPPGPLRW